VVIIRYRILKSQITILLIHYYTLLAQVIYTHNTRAELKDVWHEANNNCFDYIKLLYWEWRNHRKYFRYFRVNDNNMVIVEIIENYNC